ncbi:class I poly(R)-hydroxyalkanoic acid synthase [Hahella sp. SMD15-11]|uniref:Class I poly(R)-hydroxyalkanoic acid synthase n=1 Tax=Thermohahella caldifontis TaxID=3142973 RepID=A0AB39UY11_9GAMM
MGVLQNNFITGSVKKARAVTDLVSSQYRDALQEWIGQNKHLNDAQVTIFLEMLDTFREMGGQLARHPGKVIRKEAEFVRGYAGILGHAVKRILGKPTEPVIRPEPGDRRFADPEWEENIAFDYLRQAYLLYARTLLELAESVEDTPEHSREEFLFFTRQLVNALSPTNFPLTNPEVLRKIVETRGSNLIDGFRNFLEDYKRNPQLLNIAMTDFSAFEVGKNVAATPGKVVFQNDLMQLIQYTPTTESVYKTPLLVIPPWINKYYILDLKPKNSLIKWLVDQGHTVFVISWVNPGPELRDKSFGNYLGEGSLAALDAIEKATGEASSNVIGYCVGGTLLACTLTWLKAKGQENRIRSATYLTTLLDFSDPGGIGVFLNERVLRGIEKQIQKQGYFDGRAMAFSFNLLRENDLHWSFYVNNYLKGAKPAQFDLLYWNSDSTNLPAAMHAFYLRNMYLENRLVKPGGITLMGVPMDLTTIETPVYFLSTQQDHIAKWKATYKGVHLHKGPRAFVLSGSGHIAGVVNPPTQVKYGYWTNDQLPEDPDVWLASAQQHEGSWWPHWQRWALTFAGERVAPRIPGDGELPVIEDAPGSYVRQRVEDVISR